MKAGIVVLASVAICLALLVGLAVGVRGTGDELPLASTPGDADGWNVDLVGEVGGVLSVIALDGHHAYVGTGSHVDIVDIEGGAGVVGRTELLPEAVDGVAAEGDLLCVTAGSRLYVVDVSDDAAPQTVGSWPVRQGGYVAALQGN